MSFYRKNDKHVKNIKDKNTKKILKKLKNNSKKIK
jgi:hypothetical protein